jgi:methylglyoxal synthase
MNKAHPSDIVEIKSTKHIALIAHDSRKRDIIEWCGEHKEELNKHFLYGTGTTAKLLTDSLSLPIKSLKSGPLGGDQQIGSLIVEGEIDFMIFFWDPMSMHPHDPDVKALLRIATLYNIPIAMNRSTADFLLTSSHMDQSYPRKIINFDAYLKRDL